MDDEFGVITMMRWLVFVITVVACDVSFNAYHPLFLSDGYHYPVPDPPVQFDEPPPPPPPSYGPPIFNGSYPLDEDIPTYLPPQFDPTPTDDTVAIHPPNQYLPPPHNNPRTTDLQIYNMTCLDTNTRKFFQASFKTNNFLDSPPVVEDDLQSDCVTGFGNRFAMDLEGGKMARCGVRRCGDRVNMCVTLRMATVKGLKLPEDALVTLQCKPQDSVVAHTKQLRVKPFVIQGRSAASVASGGSQRHFETQVGLFRRSPGTSGDYTLAIAPGAALPLGEDLLLRATARDGDGWKYVRMGPVIAHHIASTPSVRTTANSVTLVNSAGCRVASMKGVCPEQPRHVTPLIVTLPMRAFMFQGAKSGDEMVLSVRILGCLQAEDCFQGTSCDDRPQARTRSKRDNTQSPRIKGNNITDWESYLEFRVVLPDDRYITMGKNSETLGTKGLVPVLLFGGVGLVVFLAVTASLLMTRKGKS